jgi:hypothetical protein
MSRRTRLTCIGLAVALLLLSGCSGHRGGFTIRNSGDWGAAFLLTAGAAMGGVGCAP